MRKKNLDNNVEDKTNLSSMDEETKLLSKSLGIKMDSRMKTAYEQFKRPAFYGTILQAPN